MEEELKEEQEKKDYHAIFIKYLPYGIIALVVLLLGLSMIGKFFELRTIVDDEKVDTVYKLTDLLFTNKFGPLNHTFYLVTYLGFPILGCIFLLLGKLHKNFIIGAVLVFLVSAITMVLSKDVTAAAYSNYTEMDYTVHERYLCYMLPIIALFIASFFSIILGSNKDSFTIGDLTEMGMLVALSVILNFIKIVQFSASGGSLNLQMLPLFILALRRGPIKGFIGAGIVFGLITCITDGYGMASYPFEYLIGFGSACILGFFEPLILSKKQKTYNFKGELFLFIGASIATFIRFVGACTSSIVIYGTPTLLAAMAYNAPYVFASGGAAIIIIMAIYGPLIRINKRYPTKKIDRELASN